MGPAGQARRGNAGPWGLVYQWAVEVSSFVVPLLSSGALHLRIYPELGKNGISMSLPAAICRRSWLSRLQMEFYGQTHLVLLSSEGLSAWLWFQVAQTSVLRLTGILKTDEDDAFVLRFGS